MKNNWFKNYRLLNKKNPSKQFQNNVRNSVLMNINQDRMEGSNNMNIKKPVKWLSVALAVALLGTASVIGVDASTDGAISNKIRVFINGNEVDSAKYISSGVTDDGLPYYCVEIGDSDASIGDSDDYVDISLTFIADAQAYLETDENGRLWLRYPDDDTLSVDITDELNQNGTYEYSTFNDDGSVINNVITGTADDYTVESTPIEECDVETQKGVDVQYNDKVDSSEVYITFDEIIED